MGQYWHSYILYGEDGKIIRSFGNMKLSEYLHSKMCMKGKYYLETRTAEQIEEWIVEWYRSEFNEVGCDGSVAKSRMPPSWLAVWRRNEKSKSE